MKKYVLFALLGVLAFGCKSSEEKKVDDVAEREPAPAEHTPAVKRVTKAYAVINPTEGNHVVGAITFTQLDEGVRIIADVGGLTPGKHGFHIHEKGDCGGDGSHAGGHFNPTNAKHGGPDSAERHVGDLGNLDAAETGSAHYSRVDKMISLNGEQSIIGKSIVVHADADDLVTDPSGNSGKRIACGLIVQGE